MTSKWFCYLLLSDDNKRTYVGATVDPDRRLRQHNGEIAGGASATRGRTWRRVCFVEGFPSEREALQFEWKWKNLSRGYTGGTSLSRRKKALQELLILDKTTNNAIPYSEWPEPLLIHWEELDGDWEGL
jgi:predicted GIY-YIG superfamily endonuclease